MGNKREKLKVTQMAEVERDALVIHLQQAEYFVWCNHVPNSPIMGEHGEDLWRKVPSKMQNSGKYRTKDQEILQKTTDMGHNAILYL